jgi:hypothetical protein
MDRYYSTEGSALASVDTQLKYEVGQGMGLFSSWSSMALLHHYIVNQLCGVSDSQYALVGDDLLLKNSESSWYKYLEIMNKIGVSVNLNKTLVSTKAPHSVEFARNYVIKGHRLTPIPVGAVFAHHAGTLSAQEVFYAFAPTFKFIDQERVLAYVKLAGEAELQTIAYYSWREGLASYAYLSQMVARQGQRLLLSEVHFANIHKVCQSEERPKLRRLQLSFTETLGSQCTMRTDEDLAKIPHLAIDFDCLRFAGDEIAEYSVAMHDRICAAQRISYLPGLGDPTTSKRERALIKDFTTVLRARGQLPPPKTDPPPD